MGVVAKAVRTIREQARADVRNDQLQTPIRMSPSVFFFAVSVFRPPGIPTLACLRDDDNDDRDDECREMNCLNYSHRDRDTQTTI